MDVPQTPQPAPVPPTPTSEPAAASPAAAPSPARFVRTFASDMEATKAGKYAPLSVKAPTPPPVHAPPPPPVPAPAPEEHPMIVVRKKGPTPLETYQGDFSAHLKESNASQVTVLAAEQDARPAPVVLTDRPKSSLPYLIGGVLLILAGAAGAYFAYTRYLAQNAPVPIVPVIPAPIFVDERQEIAGKGKALMQAVEQSATRPLAANAVRLLYAQSETGDSIFTALELPAPGILLRNTTASGSMAGVVNTGAAQSPFFILAVTSYPDTFSGMLSWEARMPADLAGLFPPNAAPLVAVVATATTTAATTTPTVPDPDATAAFEDRVVANHDVRSYRDPFGVSIVYGYWDPHTLIIARDAAAFSVIVGRLATSRANR